MDKTHKRRNSAIALFSVMVVFICFFLMHKLYEKSYEDSYESKERNELGSHVSVLQMQGKEAEETKEGPDISKLYHTYRENLENTDSFEEIERNGFRVIQEHIFPMKIREEDENEVWVIPAFDEEYNRLSLFISTKEGEIIYKTDNLETNFQKRGELLQPTDKILAISFRDLNYDGQMDIILITSCKDDTTREVSVNYKVGDVLFKDKQQEVFYRDYRITDKMNQFGMNKSSDMITAFVRDKESLEFMYTAQTLEELSGNGMTVVAEQSYPRNFEKFGRLQVIPGTYTMGGYEILIVYLVNEEGNIISWLTPMGNYENLYSLKGISCLDMDGDGLKDIVVLAKYSYENEKREMVTKTDYSIYYQRTSGFVLDTQIKESFQCTEDETMANLVIQGRKYWGWTNQE